MMMAREMDTALIKEVEICPATGETMVGDIPQMTIAGTGIALITDADLFQFLDLYEWRVLITTGQKAPPRTNIEGARLVKDLHLKNEEAIRFIWKLKLKCLCESGRYSG